MQQKIVRFRQDDRGDWIADLECGHSRHMRHNPPWTSRPWILDEEERAKFMGHYLDCVACDQVKAT